MLVLFFPHAAEAFVQNILALPSELQSLMGLHGQMEGGLLSFFLRWCYLPFSFILIVGECVALSESILGEESSGRIFFLLNRHCSRRELVLGKLVYYGTELALCLFFYLLVTSLLVLPEVESGGVLRETAERYLAVLPGNGSFLAGLARMWAGALLSGALWLLVALLYTVLARRERCRMRIGKWMSLALLAGNLWRLRDLLVLLLRRQNRSFLYFYRFTGWLRSLRGLSPLYLVNPFANTDEVLFPLYIGLCLALGAGLLGLCLLGYRLRNITQE